MKTPTVLTLLAAVGFCFAACTSTEEPAALQGNPFTTPYESTKTPPEKRVADLLQEAKQQYDDRHYAMAFRYAEQAERLIKENKFPVQDEATAVAIQAYCLLQKGLLDDYAVDNFGRQPGALTKFNRVLEINPESFRARLGVALLQFRRHGDSIRKAESLDQAVLWLEQVREDTRRALDGGAEKEMRTREAARKYAILMSNRDKYLKLGYIFRDPNSVPMDEKGRREQAQWLGKLPEGEEGVALMDLGMVIEDLEQGAEVSDRDRKRALDGAANVADSWRGVRRYWRMHALKDLQASRDRLLAIRAESVAANKSKEGDRGPLYFWVDRDLTFVYQSLGGFFLDIGLEQARLQAIAQGRLDDTLEQEARRIYTSKEFNTWEKQESRRNYNDALKYTVSFIRAHQRFERERERAKEKANYEDLTENPFLVDLVQRYRATMDELIAEERGMRASMILEAAALCIDPLFQVNDLQQALVFALQLQALAPRNPVHYFVRATAYYTDGDFAAAKKEYAAFLRDSSVAENATQRRVARQRLMECDEELRRAGGAGGNG
ncbi:MAG: hypothetical protein HS108_14785 [Planctomycetes bacterium]|jgi:hypothetical protein|nr:hypothetical protein [Planctomycetota bacterium]